MPLASFLLLAGGYASDQFRSRCHYGGSDRRSGVPPIRMALWRLGGFALSNVTNVAGPTLRHGGYRLRPHGLLLAALALYQTRPGLAGVMVGLSVSAKVFPGLLMLVCCLPEFRRSHYVGGFVLGLIQAIAFCLRAPSDFIYNTLWLLIAGTPSDAIDGSSWQYGAPFYMISTTRLAFILLMAAVSFVMISRPPDFFERCALYVICVVAALLARAAHPIICCGGFPFSASCLVRR
jgi:hypothetical protein